MEAVDHSVDTVVFSVDTVWTPLGADKSDIWDIFKINFPGGRPICPFCPICVSAENISTLMNDRKNKTQNFPNFAY